MLKKVAARYIGTIRWIAAIVIFVSYFGLFIVPRTNSSQLDFLYPMIFYYSTPLVYIVTFTALAILLWQLPPFFVNEPYNELSSKFTSFAIAMMPCGLSVLCSYNFMLSLLGAYVLPAHFERTSFEDHTYYLAWDDTGPGDIGDDYDQYFVYRCDYLGIVCHQAALVNEGNWRDLEGEERNVTFVVANNQLYVQINEEQFPVDISNGS